MIRSSMMLPWQRLVKRYRSSPRSIDTLAPRPRAVVPQVAPVSVLAAVEVVPTNAAVVQGAVVAEAVVRVTATVVVTAVMDVASVEAAALADVKDALVNA